MATVHDSKSKSVVSSWLKGSANFDASPSHAAGALSAADPEIRPSRLGLGATHVPQTALATTIQNRLLGSNGAKGGKRRSADIEEAAAEAGAAATKSAAAAAAASRDDDDDEQDSRAGAIKVNAAAKLATIKQQKEALPAPSKKAKSSAAASSSSSSSDAAPASTGSAAIKAPPPSSSRPPIAAAPSANTQVQTATSATVAAASAEPIAEAGAAAKKEKPFRKKVRSKQKNLRKDTRPDHLKPNFVPKADDAVAAGAAPADKKAAKQVCQSMGEFLLYLPTLTHSSVTCLANDMFFSLDRIRKTTLSGSWPRRALRRLLESQSNQRRQAIAAPRQLQSQSCPQPRRPLLALATTI
jgi:hypothetical protein